MSIRRVCSVALVAASVAACVDSAPAPDLGESSAELSSTEGQGWDIQGWDIQGWDIQGWDIQGWDIQGAMIGSQTVTDVNVVGTQIEIWRNTYTRAEQRLPDRTCLWSLDRTTSYGCTIVDVRSTPSPLAGVKLKGKFTLANGTTFIGWVRIGTGTSDLFAVSRDTRMAMFPLTGHSSSASCGLIDHNADNPDEEGTQICDNPNKCRRNCDIWLYDLDLLTPDGQTLPWCPGNNKATAVDGLYSDNGQYKPAAAGITLACTNGTIAKCTRWGYRPFGSARKNCLDSSCINSSTLYSLQNYHQSCIRAAMADYCASGDSFTRNGTLVDIYDFEKRSDAGGFIPRTIGLIQGQTSAFLRESLFDRYGAHQIDHLRYQESNPTLEATCGGDFTFYGGSDDVPPTWMRNTINQTPPYVWVDSTTACSHSEHTVGKWLHEDCLGCTRQGPPHCTDPSSSKGWNAECVAAAQSGCPNANQFMTKHSECVVSPTNEPLNKFATGCTLRVCSTAGYESCCTSAWTSTCVNAAKSLCKGGQEGASRFANFCSSGINTSPGTTLPSTTKTL